MYHHIMSFHWGTDVGVFLFPGLDITGTPALIILCLILLVLSLIYEAVKVFQTSSKARTARERLQSSSSTANETTNLLISERRTASGNASASNRFLSMLAQAVVFLFENVLSYMLMLSVMVYNVYVFMAIVLGMGLGYFLFGHISMKINMENIRARTTNAICSEVNRLAVTSSSSRNVGENQVEFQGNPHCSTSYSQSANYEHVSNIQSEVDIHPCVDAQNTDNLHTCRL